MGENLNLPDIVIVRREHIKKGIEKYQGIIDLDIKGIFERAGQSVEPFLFNDGRILLIYPGHEHGILYRSKELMFDRIVLE